MTHLPPSSGNNFFRWRCCNWVGLLSCCCLYHSTPGVPVLRARESFERGPVRDPLACRGHFHELRVVAEGVHSYRGVAGLCGHFGAGFRVRGALLAGNQGPELGKGIRVGGGEEDEIA